MVNETDDVQLTVAVQYVSRAALKLASVSELLKLDFRGKTVLDVGSSTGGFTQYALKQGAVKVIAVEVGTDQLHPTLRSDARIELHEQTDIRDIKTLSSPVDMVVMDVSFVSLRDILPSVAKLVTTRTQLVAMVKPQFEVGQDVKHKGVIKNDRMRRDILQSFESWAKQRFVVIDKADSEVAGAKGNRERFYLLKKLSS
jgi:23S rRNA (cytidine1920-2'-O)/16S rRNA (cytidine1409-2'-O)-methyltransferase